MVAGRTSPPARLDTVARLIDGADGWSDGLREEIKETAGADMRGSGFGDDGDRYMDNLHRTAVVRAARDALSS